MLRRTRNTLALSALMTAGACSLVTNVDEVLCPKSDPDCDANQETNATATGGDNSGTGGEAGDTGSGGDAGGAAGGMSIGMGGCSGVDCGPAAGCPPYGSVLLEYHNGEESVDTDRIRPHFRLFNQSEQVVDFSDLEIRYYYTEDEGATPSYYCSFAFGLNSGEGCGDLLDGKLTAFAANGANSVLSLTFKGNPARMEPNRRSLEIEGQIRLPSSEMFDQSNDYSFTDDPSYVEDYAAWDKVTLYCKGRLLYGTEPSSN